jgi:ABC-type multidrug transport system ATPase subunit
VHAQGLGKVIDDRPLLHGLDFTIARGSHVALLGSNGAGKSTLLRIIGLLTPPSAGTLELFGRSVDRDDPAIRSRIGMIAHGAMLYRTLTARENLLFFGRLYGVPGVEARTRELLDMVGLLNRADDAVQTFSRGMLQRVSIARALMHEPELLLADEPFTGLDTPSRDRLESLLDDVRRQGTTIIMANHDVAQSLVLADQVIVLRNGRQVLEAMAPTIDVDQVYETVAAR